MIDGLFGSLVGAASGGILGLAGSLVNKVANYFATQQQMKFEELKNRHSLALMDKQAQLQQMQIDGKFQITALETDSENLVASYKHDASYGETYKWAASLLRFVRPGLTFGILGIFIYVFYTANEFGHVSMIENMSSQISLLASMCLSWWFSDRSAKK